MTEYQTLQRELTEMLTKTFTYKDLNTIGKDMFGRKYDTHKLEGLNPTISISPINAARRLILECNQSGKLETLALTLIQLDGNYLNDRVVKVFNLENFLYHQAQGGTIYDDKRKKFVSTKTEWALMPNWGALKNGKEYLLTVASVDIVKNSVLVKKYGSPLMERVYKRLFDFIREALSIYDGRIWSWQGDGGLVAFPKGQDVNISIACCLHILLTLPLFNMHADYLLKNDIVLRIGLDRGQIKFFENTGQIVSETINYAAHLEKSATEPWGISLSEDIHKDLGPSLKKLFTEKTKFEGRYAYSRVITHDKVMTRK